MTSGRGICRDIVSACLAAVGCGPADLGQDPHILWWTDHETGDFSDWDQGGYHWASADTSTQIVTTPNPARSGRFSFQSTVTSPGSGTISGAQASRSGNLPNEAYYSAWYYLPSAVQATSYWLLFKFRSRSDPTDASTAVDVWDVDILTDNNGSMFYELFEHKTSTRWEDHAAPIPIQRWFQIEAYLRVASDSSGQITVWIDGSQVFNVSGQSTLPTAYVEWNVGSVAEVITPNPATMFINDAAVSTRRLGPDFPVFWRD